MVVHLEAAPWRIDVNQLGKLNLRKDQWGNMMPSRLHAIPIDQSVSGCQRDIGTTGELISDILNLR
jgi:hypothetical protein